MKTNAKSVVYCRVSSQAQLKKGDGLASQETRCREFARMRGYSVEEVFYDEGISGKLLDRAKMRDLLAYLTEHAKKEPIIVIIDDISRLARDLETHIRLRTAIADAGGKLESPAIEFGEDSDSRLVEHLLASVAAHQREKNAEQVKNRMRARMQNGYWVFQAPIGYKYERKSGHGKVLVADEPVASIVIEALEGFATGRFETQSEVKYFLLSKPGFPRDGCGDIHVTKIREMLERILYTGYMEYKPWGIMLQPGKHQPLIDFETYNKIQDRLHGQAKAPVRKDIKEDFPLRGFVLCGTCQTAMTACWSAGRTAKYPYYLCRNKDCPDCKKSVRKETLEEDFETILHKLTPTPDLMYITRQAVKKVWKKHKNGQGLDRDALKKQIKEIDKKIEQFMDRIVETDSPTLIKAYETKITKMEFEKASISSRLASSVSGPLSFEESFQTVFDFIENPQKLWHSEDLEDRRLVLKLVFTRPLAYHRKEGFQTAAIALPFGLSGQLINDNSVLVEPVGLEPTTSTLPALRSTG
jgi:site-specific DNA recombinase